ncbi:acyl carrier protein [bacterium]|nr:acyl carrier protein [bacterium]
MTEQRLEDTLKKLIINRLRLDKTPDEIDEQQPLFGEGLGLDSIDALELVVGLEEEFSITIPDEDVGKEAFASINALANYIRTTKHMAE